MPYGYMHSFLQEPRSLSRLGVSLLGFLLHSFPEHVPVLCINEVAAAAATAHYRQSHLSIRCPEILGENIPPH